MVMYIIVGLVVIFLIYILVLYNMFIKWNNKVNEAFSTMDVYLKKRWDLIPNLVSTVKAYAKHETETLEDVVKARNGQYDNMSIDDKLATNEKIGPGLNKLLFLTETYPELKANENYLDLSKQLAKVEDDIANARKYYNAVVRLYNDKVEIFPNNMFSKVFGFKSKTMFEANSRERESVKVDF